jgi:hypothetical protein
VTRMDPKTVDKLERKIEDAIADTITKMGIRKLPLLPSHQTLHLMAKAAVAVYEAPSRTVIVADRPRDQQKANHFPPRANPRLNAVAERGHQAGIFPTQFIPLQGPCDDVNRSSNLPRSTAMWRLPPK